MANEPELTRVKCWVEHSALELGLLLQHFQRPPATLPTAGKKKKPLDLYSLAAVWEENIASDIEALVLSAAGSPAHPDPMGKVTNQQLFKSMSMSQISLAASLKAMLLLYRVPALSFPLNSSPPYAAELPLLDSIVGWLTKQSADLKKLLNLNNLTPNPPPKPHQFANVNSALNSWERTLTKMAQDLAYVMSQHPRHLIHPLKGVALRPGAEP